MISSHRSKQRILDLLLANLTRPVDASDIRRANGNSNDWTTKLHQLRGDGYQIRAHVDHGESKVSQYVLESIERLPAFKRGISRATQEAIFKRDNHVCQMCGHGAGDFDQMGLNRTVRLTLGHIIDKSKGGDDSPTNLRAVCTNCNEGLQNTSPPKPDRIHLLAQIRRATIQDQKAALEWLKKKFKESSTDG